MDTIDDRRPRNLQEYTFTLTHGDGKRFQGFCRKYLPPPPKVGSKLRYPQCICLISEYPWCNFYFKVRRRIRSMGMLWLKIVWRHGKRACTGMHGSRMTT